MTLMTFLNKSLKKREICVTFNTAVNFCNYTCNLVPASTMSTSQSIPRESRIRSLANSAINSRDDKWARIEEGWKIGNLTRVTDRMKEEVGRTRKARKKLQGGGQGAERGTNGADVQKCLRLAEPCVEKGYPEKSWNWMGRTARTDVPKVIRYFEARKRKCQFANPGRKLRRRAQAL